jgi:hypothetical protein
MTMRVTFTTRHLQDPAFPSICVMSGDQAQTVSYVGPTGAALPVSPASARRLRILPRIGYWLIGVAVMFVVSAIAVPLPAGVSYWVNGILGFVGMASLLFGGSFLGLHMATRPQITVIGPTADQPGVQTIELRNAHPLFAAAVQQYLNQGGAAVAMPSTSPLPDEPK